ncbi:unnamed protein product [Tenebrio molitor]|nr:unnamed protein product [Tenebrio molitor]
MVCPCKSIYAESSTVRRLECLFIRKDYRIPYILMNIFLSKHNSLLFILCC